MKLFVLLSRFPYPLEKGDKLRAYYQIRELSKKHEIHLICLSDHTIKKEWEDELEPYCRSIHTFKLSRPLLYWNTAKQIFTDKPFQIGYFYQSGIQRKINQLIKELNPDHIYCQLVRTAEYVKNIHEIPKTLDYQDALSKGMFRRAGISSGIKKRLFRMEGRRLSEYENRIFDFFNHHTIISEQDRAYINHPGKNDIIVVENGIDERFFDYPLKEKAAYTLLFTGNMNYPPNVECAEYIAHQIMPVLPEYINLTLFGASPHSRVEQLANKRIHVAGWIDDIRDAYAGGKVFVAPLFIGTGLQNKLLEAMAMGLPVITTNLANNALGANPEKEILIAETPEEFASAIQQLLNNEKRYNEISTAARKFVRENFKWENSVLKLERLFNKD